MPQSLQQVDGKMESNARGFRKRVWDSSQTPPRCLYKLSLILRMLLSWGELFELKPPFLGDYIFPQTAVTANLPVLPNEKWRRSVKSCFSLLMTCCI